MKNPGKGDEEMRNKQYSFATTLIKIIKKCYTIPDRENYYKLIN